MAFSTVSQIIGDAKQIQIPDRVKRDISFSCQIGNHLSIRIGNAGCFIQCPAAKAVARFCKVFHFTCQRQDIVFIIGHQHSFRWNTVSETAVKGNGICVCTPFSIKDEIMQCLDRYHAFYRLFK